MLIVPERQRLVINTNAPADILAAIPHAKSMVHDGQQLVALHHGPEEALVLKNLGYSVPAPIRSYYSWPGRFKPMAHQVETAAFLTTNRKALCLNGPGTGKSLTSLWAADYLMGEGAAKKVLIICPKSTLNAVWGREIYHHLPHRSFAIIAGSRQKRLDLLATPGLQYAIINHDGFTNMAPDLNGFDVVIYDEGTAVKSASSQRYKVFSKWVAQHNPWLWILTGTPISQTPTDAWTLARLVGSPTVPKSFTAFKDMVMNRVTTFKWVPRANALDICKQVLQPSIRFSLDECVDIPDMNYVGRHCDLTPTQARLFKDMQDNAITTFQGNSVTAANAAVVLGKLAQICGGVVYDESGQHIAIDASTRYDALKELVDEIGDKVIIFCPLRGAQDVLQAALKSDGYDVEVVHGGVGDAERRRIFNDFQHTNSIRILLAHPKVAAHGLTLTRAKDVIWYLPIYSLESYEQANARVRRIGTTGKTTVWHLWSTPFEKELYRRLQHKRKVLGEFLQLVNGINSD